MENQIKIGLRHTEKLMVTARDTAHAVGNSGAHVFSTPAMLLLIENTCGATIQPALTAGQITVGIMANFDHLAATPVGMMVRCDAEVIEIDRRRIRFAVTLYDEVEKVGEGVHDRFVIDNAEDFVAKTNAKSAAKS
ncbi:MAG: thioesterase family protein [Chloroflexota bacterium]